MEDLNDINFLAVIEGRDYEHSLKKIVSICLFDSFPCTSTDTRKETRKYHLIFGFWFTGLYEVSLHSIGCIGRDRGYSTSFEACIFGGGDRIWNTRGSYHRIRL